MNVEHSVLELITDAADILNKCLIYLSGPDDSSISQEIDKEHGTSSEVQ